MRTSPEIDKLAPALVKAQASLKNPARNKEATVKGRSKGGAEYEYTYGYASLDSILDIVRPALADAGLYITQGVVGVQAPFTLVTRITHASGQWQETDMPLPYSGSADPRELGIAFSYSRRYAVAPALGIASEEDTDTGRGKAGARKGATAGIGDALDEPTKNRMTDIALVVQDFAKAGRIDAAAESWEGSTFPSNEAKIYSWNLLPSKTRSAIKALLEQRKAIGTTGAV